MNTSPPTTVSVQELTRRATRPVEGREERYTFLSRRYYPEGYVSPSTGAVYPPSTASTMRD